MKPPIIGLVGRRGSGKTTVAARLCNSHGYVRMAFAEPLKDMLRAIGLDDVYLGSLKEQPCTLLRGAKLLQSKEEFIVADDVRFANEAATVRSMGGALWYVERGAPAAVDGHVSETELAGIACDACLANDGTIAELEAFTDGLMS